MHYKKTISLSDVFIVIWKKKKEKAYLEFTNGMTRVLISTNLTARGIDVQQVSTVINFDLPKDIHTYIHRIGRSGRWGRKGMGINFITRRDIKKMRELKNTMIHKLLNYHHHLCLKKHNYRKIRLFINYIIIVVINEYI